jgi:dynein heavy chain
MSIIPEAILQRCIKVSNESPSDLMSNMLRAYSKFSDERINNAPQPNVFKAILTGLCYFHAVVLGRKKFGSAGWSRIYNFNDGDLTICADVLENYLSKYDKVPYDDLRYIYGEIMYGGHITDNWDRRTNNTYLSALITPEILLNKGNIVPGAKVIRVPDPTKTNYSEYIKWIEGNFADERPYMFGMHSNAEINFLTNQCDYIFNTIIDIRGGSGSNSSDADPEKLVNQYKELPEPFSMIELRSKVAEINRNLAGVKTASPEDLSKFPPNPYQNVALQECETMAELIGVMKLSLEELGQGIRGELNMTDSMDQLYQSLLLNRVPAEWVKFYFNKRPLASWFADLKERYNQGTKPAHFGDPGEAHRFPLDQLFVDG